MKRGIFTAIMATAFTMAALGAAGAAENQEAIAKLEAAKGNYLASLRMEALQTGNPVPERMSTGPASAWLKKVASNEVNMATNTFEKKEQRSINIDGKSYFTNGEASEFNLAENSSARFGIDPLTNKRVDKASAAAYADASGRVFYFESDATFQGFIALATPQTVYGYSAAK
ncbi:MAG: hypothetical protein A2X99_06980 [Deltaproteobacteria bacterium GWB2_55_19]|nr:MAG: hypothetical protein A2X99_06980 [Deltaproteobacteria bacterium GWB2_55_19]HAO92988.1 hypothetical protein [Deltaproteobacteria bacterium]